jgi:hypothetical protein
MTGPVGDVPPNTAALAAVRLWLSSDGRVAARLTTVDDLAMPEEQVVVTADLDDLVRRVHAWIAATAARLVR